jgi:acetolactate synthase-1/3 small subunit
MKKATSNLFKKYIIAVYADDKKGLLNQLLMIINRKSYEVCSLNVSRTDMHDVVLIAMEVMLPPADVYFITQKMNNIIEVYKTISHPVEETQLLRIGQYKIAKNYLSSVAHSLHRYGASITEILDDSFIIQRTGTAYDLNELLNYLDGEHLLSYCSSPLISGQSLISIDEYFVSA